MVWCFVPETLFHQIRIFSTDYAGSILFEPPKIIKFSLYKCDSKFHLDPILEMYKEEAMYGIVLISGKDCYMYTLSITGSHNEIKKIYQKKVELQGQFSKGGQSQNRLARIIKEKKCSYIKSMGESMVKAYMRENNTQCSVQKIVIGGPADVKRNLKDLEIVQKFLGSKIVKLVDTAELGSDTPWEVYEKCSEIFSEGQSDEEKEIIKEINELISKGDDKLIFGKKELTLLLGECMVSKILINTDDEKIIKRIKQLNTYNCQIVESKSKILKNYGDAIGIKWY